MSLAYLVTVRIFLELADNVDIDEILDEFKNWPDQITNFRATYMYGKLLDVTSVFKKTPTIFWWML